MPEIKIPAEEVFPVLKENILVDGFHVVIVEECTYDRSLLSHKVNLFDMHHKYADVMHLDEVAEHLEAFPEA